MRFILPGALLEPAPDSIGAGEGSRTPDLLITNQLLYQLSYASDASTQNEAPPKGRRSRVILAEPGGHVNRQNPYMTGFNAPAGL
jgi:hypothetical protein